MKRKIIFLFLSVVLFNISAFGQDKSNSVRLRIGMNKLLVPLSRPSHFKINKTNPGIYTDFAFIRSNGNESRAFIYGASYSIQSIRQEFREFDAVLNNPEHEIIPNINILYTQNIQSFSLLAGFQKKLNRSFSLGLELKLGYSTGFTPKVDHGVSYDTLGYWLPNTKVSHYLTRDKLSFISSNLGLNINYNLSKVWTLSFACSYSRALPIFNKTMNSATLPVLSIIKVNDKQYQESAEHQFSTINTSISIKYKF